MKRVVKGALNWTLLFCPSCRVAVRPGRSASRLARELERYRPITGRFCVILPVTYAVIGRIKTTLRIKPRPTEERTNFIYFYEAANCYDFYSDMIIFLQPRQALGNMHSSYHKPTKYL